MTWDKSVEIKFKEIIAKIPIFMRDIAEKKVLRRIEKILSEGTRSIVTEKDMIDAFFKETPFGFHGPMKTDMDLLGIDYKKYGY
ncbi:MAG: hypothetical protein HQL25_07420 [Candidatus Omnitrophica bacterium]|nr:hypothetical protein [Candidatus Omnitrophota bacterium]